MSFPVGTTITFEALARTEGYPPANHTFAWDFGDGSAASGNPVGHAYATAGLKQFTVNATSINTGGSGSATGVLKILNPASVSWHDSGAVFSRFGTDTAFTFASQQTHFGTKIATFCGWRNPLDVMVYDTVSRSYSEFLSVLPSGGFRGARMMDRGPLAGKALLFGGYNGVYGYWDFDANTYSALGTGGPRGNVSSNPSSCPSVVSGRFIVTAKGQSNHDFPGTGFMLFDQDSLSWSDGPSSPSVVSDQFFTLPSGRVMSVKNNTTNTFIYDPSSGLLIAGPSAPYAYPQGVYSYGESSRDGSVWGLGSSNMHCFTESVSDTYGGSWSTKSVYPASSVTAGASENTWAILVSGPSGELLDVGGRLEPGGLGTKKNCLYYMESDSFGVWGSAPGGVFGQGGPSGFIGNRCWVIDYGTSKLFYSDELV